MSYEYGTDTAPTNTVPLVPGWGYFVDLFGSQVAHKIRVRPGSPWAPSVTFDEDGRTGFCQPTQFSLGISIFGFLRFLTSDEGIAVLNLAGSKGTLSADSLTADRTYTLPNQSGVLALENILEKINGEAFSIQAGQPVALDGTTDCELALADTAANCALGLMTGLTASAATGQILATGFLELPDWTNVTGTTSLTVNDDYFLSPSVAGALTNTPPDVAPGFLQYVGKAVTAQKMFVQIARPIQL